MFAAVFPGQGSQYVGMGYDFFCQSAAVKNLFDEAEHILRIDLKKAMFEGPEEILRETKYAQPAIFITSMAVMSFLKEIYDFPPESFAFFAGHSLGEYAALCAAGVISFTDTIELIKIRCNAMSKITGGGMVALIGLAFEKAQALVASLGNQHGTCEIANDNALDQVVISGDLTALHKISDAAKAAGAHRCVFLNVSGPFHSSLMKSAQKEFEDAIKHVIFHNPCSPVITNVSAIPQTEPPVLKEHLSRQISSGVLWRATQLEFEKLKVTQLVEIGAGKVLCGLAKKTIPSIKAVSLSTIESVTAWASVNLCNETIVSAMASVAS